MCATRFSYVSGIETHQAYIIRRSKNISLSLYFSYSNTISNKGGRFLKKLWCCVGGRV